MNQSAAHFYKVLKRARPDLSKALIRRVAENYGTRYPDDLEMSPQRAERVMLAYIRHNRTNYDNSWRESPDQHKSLRKYFTEKAERIIEKKFLVRELSKDKPAPTRVTKSRARVPKSNGELGALMDAHCE